MMVVLVACSVSVPVMDGTWTAQCADMSREDCEGVGTLFVGNLARSSEALRHESGGVIRITPEACPPLPDWAVPGTCWRAIAPTTLTARACMLIARQKPPAALGPFGQVGGDNFTGLLGAPEPGTTPC